MSSNQNNLNSDDAQSNSYEQVSLSKLEKLKRLGQVEVSRWIEHETKFWKEIFQSLQRQVGQRAVAQVHPTIVKEVQEYLSALEDVPGVNLSSAADLGWDDGESLLAARLNTLFSYDLPQHDDPHASEFKNSCHVGEATSAIYTFRLLSKYPQQHYLRGYEEGVALNLKKLTDSVDDKVAKTISEVGEREGNINGSIKSAEEELTKIVAAATSAIALSEPVKFWEDRRVIHNVNAQKYGKYASISAIIFAITLGVIVIYEYMSGVSHTWLGYEFTLPKSLSGIAVILLISTAGIWSTRIFVKLMMANLTLETESIERATMIKTFVAMKAAEATIAQEAELLFYTTLFRPSNNAINEESTAPEFGKILDAILKVKPDKPGSTG